MQAKDSSKNYNSFKKTRKLLTILMNSEPSAL